MVQIYIKHIDGNYYALDLDKKEAVNYKVTVKDLSDITKIFSPFTQSFNLEATDKNKILCGFYGNEKIYKPNPTAEFDAMIYVHGFLFQSGKLKFKESEYENKTQKNFKTDFASNLTGIVQKLGNLTIQDLFNQNDPNIKIPWNVRTLSFYNNLTSIRKTTLANGIELRYGIPFISNQRAWSFDDDLNLVDNIAFNQARKTTFDNCLLIDEVRPAVSFKTILEHLFLKIGVPIICPILNTPDIADLFVWCNSENLVVQEAKAFPLINYDTDGSYLRYDVKNGAGAAATTPNWTVTIQKNLGIFSVQRNMINTDNRWGNGFDAVLIFNNLTTPSQGQPIKIKVNLINAITNEVIDSQEITGDTYSFRIIDELKGKTQLDANGQISFKFEILPLSLVSWSTITAKTIQEWRRERQLPIGQQVSRAKFSFTVENKTASSELGGNSLNLINTLPKIKCVDFLRSFLKTFNISVISTGLQDQSMYWVTPENIKEINKPYSKRVVTYTNAVLTNKKEANNFNQYSFSHKESKYFDSVFGNGKRFGSLSYPETPPEKATNFEVKTDFSIIKQNNYFTHPSGAKSCFGFQNDIPEVLENGGLRYKPVFDEFTIFYLKSKSLGLAPIGAENTLTLNRKIPSILEATFYNKTTGNTLAFGAEDVYTKSLYFNYYKGFIELLLNPNTYLSSFDVDLPPNEIFLNLANTNQNESNIPTGFRPQNEIIISEQRYQLVDATINLKDGKTKLNLLNF